MRGCTPVIPGAVQRSRSNMLFTVTNRGRLAFMVFEGPFTVAVCIRFLQRMVRHVGRKVFLVLDRHPVHRSVEVKRWLDAHAKEIMLFFLPDYDPDLNIDEFLYQDVNSNSLRRCPPVIRTEMIDRVRPYQRSTERQHDVVKNYFQAEPVRDVAG